VYLVEECFYQELERTGVVCKE